MSYDLEIASSGGGWMGTFAVVMRRTVSDMLDDGPYGPVEVMVEDGTVYVGEMAEWSSEDAFTITVPGMLPIVIEIEDVRSFRA